MPLLVRWMVIDGYTLNSYKKKGDKKPKKVFDLSAISNDMLDYPIGSGKAPPTEHHFCVRLHTRMLNLCFESEEDRATWFKRMEAIREELCKLPAFRVLRLALAHHAGAFCLYSQSLAARLRKS